MSLLQTNAESPNVLNYSGVSEILYNLVSGTQRSKILFVPNTIIFVMCKKPSLKYETPSKKSVIHKFRLKFFF